MRVKPSQAFEIVLHIAATGVIVAWGDDRGVPTAVVLPDESRDAVRPKFRMPLSPYSGYATLVSLLSPC